MTTAFGTLPVNPESVALDLIPRIGDAVPGADALRASRHHLAGVLQLEGAQAGLATMADARLAAATIAEAACTAADPDGALRIRAAALRAGCWNSADPQGLALALDGAATVLDAM